MEYVKTRALVKSNIFCAVKYSKYTYHYVNVQFGFMNFTAIVISFIMYITFLFHRRAQHGIPGLHRHVGCEIIPGGWGGGGGGYTWEFLVEVCRPVLQILTLFRTKKCYFPHPSSDLACRQKLYYIILVCIEALFLAVL